MPCRAEKLALTKANSPSTGGHLFDAPILHPPRPPARDLITEIPDGAILEAIRAEVRWAVRRAPLHSLVLTACRAWLYAAEGRFASKQDADDWAAQRYPHASLIRAAVARRQDERGIRINRSAAELVTPPVPESTYRCVSGGTYNVDGGAQQRYDTYLPAAPTERPPPVVIFVHGDGPPDFLREPRLWGQYRSWGQLAAANGMAAITFDHGSTEDRIRIQAALNEIGALLETVERDADTLGLDASRIAVWSGSAGVPFGFVAALDDPSVRCQVAFYGPMDLWTDDSRTAPDVSADVLAEYSPITHLERRGGEIQPLFIAKAGLDRAGINDSIDAFVARAAELDAPVTLEAHPDGRHAFDILDSDDRSREIIGQAIDSMRGHLTR